MTCKILLPVDGSQHALRAAQHVASLQPFLKDLEVQVLSVQSLGDDWRVRRVLKPEELASMEQEWAEDAMAPVRSLLQAAGVKHQEHLVQGEVAASIAQQAKALGCAQIVMGSHGHTALGGLLMGSVTTKVLHLSDVPVTLVK